MNLLNAASLVLFAVLIAAGQYLFKHSAMAVSGLNFWESLVALARHPEFYAALGLYGSSTLLWVWILTRVPLSLAYPVVALGMVMVPLIGWYFFGEHLSFKYWVGTALIVAGMLTMQLSA